MEVVCISSDSEENSRPAEEVKMSPSPESQISTWNDDVYNVDWNDEAYPSVNYEAELSPKENENETDMNQIEDIEDDITVIEANEVNTETNKDENINSASDDNGCSFSGSIKSSNLIAELEKKIFGQKNSNFKIPETSNVKQSKQKLTQELKEKANNIREQKRLERERLKEEKKAEQMRQKALKAALLENHRNLKPEENIKFLKVHIDNEIINSAYGGNIISLLQQNNIQYVVEAQIKCCTITWSKRRVEKIYNNYGDLAEKVENKDEEELLYVLPWQKAVELISSKELLSHVETIKSSYIGKKLTLIIYGLGKYFDYRKLKKNKTDFEKKRAKCKPHEVEFENAPRISADDLEFALIDLQLIGKHNCRLFETPEELSTFVYNITKSLSQIDYKLEKQKRQENDLGWFAKGDSAQCVKVDKNGNGLLSLWQQQICQFSNVSLETAQAVVSQYTSPLALINDYKTCGNEKEGELLLQNIQIRRNAGILSSTRRVGPQLSKKIHKFFTSDDPELEL